MTVNTTSITSGPYTGNGVTTSFPYTFKAFTDANIIVYQTVGTVQSTLTLGTHYSVTGTGVDGGGNVVMVTAPALSDEIYIRSNYSAEQLTDFDSQGGFYPDTHEDAFDKQTMLIQQLEDIQGRSLRLPLGDSGGVMPELSPNPLRLLRWNAAGDAVENVDITLIDPDAVATDLLVYTVETFAALATTPATTAGMVVYIKQHTSGGVGGGHFQDTSGTITNDGGTLINNTATAGRHWKRINYSLIDSRFYGTSDDALPAGAVVALEHARDDYVAHSGGTSDIRNFLNRSQLNGSYGAQQMITHSLQSEVRHTAGTVTFAYGIQGFSRLGRLGSTTGDITTFRGIEWHTANEGSGNITDAFNFYSQEIDLLDGTGNIVNIKGFLCGDQGHATRVTGSAIGFDCANFTSGSPLTVSFRSQMTSGTGRWSFLGAGSAPSALAGNLRVGNVSIVPSDALEVNGYAKISNTGTYTTASNYHEINSSNNDYVLHVKSTHASAPNGLRLRFTGAAPNNTTQEFLRCEDSSTNRLIIYSNGNVVNQNNSYGAISDIRLKTEVSDAPSVLDKFRIRQFKTYKLKESNETILGVIAQDELNVSPNLVTLGDDNFYSYNYSGLAVEASQAVSELLKIIDDLKQRIEALECGAKKSEV